MSEQKNPVGRPSELPEVLEKIKEYINGGWELVGDRIPQIAGAAIYCGKHKDSLYQYAKESEEFSDYLEIIMTYQENRLLNKGLDGTFNSTITKMLLTKHGYSDRLEQDINANVSLTPTLSDFYAGVSNETGSDNTDSSSNHGDDNSN